LHQARGATETNRQLFSKQNRLQLPGNSFDAEMLSLAVAPVSDRRAFSRQLVRCIDAGMMQCPSKLSPQELISLIKMKLDQLGADKALHGTVYNRVKRAFKQKCDKAQAFRSFSERVTNPAIRPDHITYKRFDTPHMTKDVLDYIKALNGPVIVRAGMGSGKSKHLLRPMMHSAQRGVSVAHRVSLIGGLWDMMTRADDGRRMNCDILHYQDPGYQELAPYASKLTICINSIVKGCWQPLMRKHDFFGLDEATQGLRATLSGKAMAHPVDVFNRLIDSIAYSDDHALLVDADASDILVDLCELALAKREQTGLSTWTQIHVIELPVDVKYKKADGTREARRVLYTDTDRIMVEVLKAVAAGEKFLLATDSTNFAEQLLLQLRDRWPDKKWLYVSQDTKPDQEVVAFTDAPNQRAKLYDGLIYSPAISSGVSIEEKHFTRHFGCFCGQVVPSDAIQMLRRDRTATEFMVGLNKLPGVREENADNIRRGFLQALLETAEINEEFTDAILDGDRLSLGLADTTYVRMKFKVAAMEAQARNDFANNLICILYADGYNVSHLAEDSLASETGKELRKASKERVWDMTVLRHMEVETP
ncbi:TPA: plasmid replication protein, CyRepA1 family, partial [Salmonella enterica subsp. enterica serovar Enteritidis]